MIVRAVPCDQVEARALLAPILARKTDQERRYNLDDVIAQGQPYKMLDEEGATVGAYVLEPMGPVLWISAIAGRAAFDLTCVIDALTMGQGRHFEQVGFRTERPGLVRKAQRLGYQVQRREGPAYFLRKNIKP